MIDIDKLADEALTQPIHTRDVKYQFDSASWGLFKANLLATINPEEKVIAVSIKGDVKPVGINQIPNADILEVMRSFEDTLDIKLRPVDEQRRYAKFLIKDYGKQKVLDGVQAIAAARGRPYSPSITSLKELHFKWGKLVDFYARQVPKQSNVANLDNLG